MCAFQKKKPDSANAFRNACATTISKVWRGYCCRIHAEYLRKEMAQFLFAIREEEARDEEEEYLDTRPLQRYRAQFRKQRK